MAWNGLILNSWKELRHRLDSNWFDKSLKNRSVFTEAFSLEKVFLKILEDSQENTCTGVSF